jgi:hypothetical protein
VSVDLCEQGVGERDGGFDFHTTNVLPHDTMRSVKRPRKAQIGRKRQQPALQVPRVRPARARAP